MTRSVRAAVFAAVAMLLVGREARSQTAAAPQKTPPALGTIKSISADGLVLTPDSGGELKVQLPADVKVFQVPPGSKDLKEATAIPLSDLQVGDRVLVQMRPGDTSGSFLALRVIAMKKADIAERQGKEREEWQKHGIGGLVKSVDPANGTVTIGTLTAAGSKDVVIHVSKDTVLRRYAPGSVKFEEAKPAPLTEVRGGDQLRARGARSTDGNEFSANEIVSGSFRNIAGTIVAIDASAGTLTVNDIAVKKPVELKVTADSQMRKLPQMMAQAIAMRLKGDNGGAPPANGTAPSGAQSGAANAPTTGQAGPGGNGNGGRRAGGDIQQVLSRLPVSPLTDFQKGDVVMIVATGETEGPTTVITLLGGVEPILQATTRSQAASILTPWSLNQGGGGEMGTP